MEIQEEDLVGLMKTVWSSLVGLEIVESGDATPAADEEPTISASVNISGAWQGTVALICAVTTARRIAAAMFKAPASGISSDDVGDCLGELANVIAGNVKAATLIPCDVSLPSVEFGPHSAFHATGKPLVWMSCEGDPITVTVVKPSDVEIATHKVEGAKR